MCVRARERESAGEREIARDAQSLERGGVSGADAVRTDAKSCHKFHQKN